MQIHGLNLYCLFLHRLKNELQYLNNSQAKYTPLVFLSFSYFKKRFT